MSIGEIAVRPRTHPLDEGAAERQSAEEPIEIPLEPRTGPAVRYLSVAGVLLLVNWAANTFWTRSTVFGNWRAPAFAGDQFLGGWVRWDSTWYRTIATDGYSYTPGRPSSVAFFPGYPTAMRLVGHVVGDALLAGVVITIGCGLLSAVLLHRFARLHCGSTTARIAVVALLVYPYAWYLFGAVYSDAFFLAAVLGAFLLAEADHPLLAGLCGALATATRPVGIAVVIGLVVLEVARSRGRRRRLDLALVSVGGLVAWCTYLWRSFGDPLLFLRVEGTPGWDEPPGMHTLFKVPWFEQIARAPDNFAHRTDQQAWFKLTYLSGTVLQAALAVGALALLPRIRRRLGWPYALYTAVAVGIAVVGSKDWQGLGRYLLAAFPVFVAFADLVATRVGRNGRVALAATSACLLVFLTSAFARGHYLA